ncbi:MORC family CW-type zinc finger protein 3-like isoform X1 [Rana temporaria]|uniref:MORC family CW-type zinc finger protein 3-like isoform X1 n=1 Tax=Rana temporaria TaxID=8407 RepID=UPI001AAD736A|nr:MORC family CW-type zinc finger protein 3-like isoform X1 [Rana temporaria]
MAAHGTDGIRLSALCPRFLHTNSTSHTWPFSAVAELIDNAYDPDVSAKQFWIDKTVFKQEICLTFTDNGNGMDLDKLHKMLSFGFSDKVAVHGHVPVGLYGNGFKSGSMRLGKDAIVFTKNENGLHVGMLSQTYLEKINAEHVIVPIISFDKQKQLVKTQDSDANLRAILTHSLLKTQTELLAELEAIKGKKGTRIIIWNLRRSQKDIDCSWDKRGCTEFDFVNDKYDIRIPEETDGSNKKGYKKQDRMDQVAPDSDYSLRAYCSILYLKPRMQIIIRGEKVQTQLVSKSLALIEKDVYRPKFLAPKTVKITFGYNCRNKEHYGIMMYHKNRLIKAYVRVGCQLKANNMGVGVVGIIECNFLKPTHNKQDFDYTNDYRLTLTALGEKLNDYWQEMKLKKNTLDGVDLPMEDVARKPDQVWAQCDNCLKWRKIPDGVKLPSKWFCSMNADPQFRDCTVPEEPEDDDEITHSTYEKTHKRRKSELLLQLSNKPTILSTPLNKDMQAALSRVQAQYRPMGLMAAPPTVASETAGQTGFLADRLKRPGAFESSMIPAKKPHMTISETIELPDGDDEDVATDFDVIIIEEDSTPKPNDNAKPVNSTAPGLMTAATTQTDRGGTTIKKEVDSNGYANFQASQQVPNTDYSYCNGTTTQDGSHHVNPQSSEDYYHKQCDELSAKVKHLQDQLAEALGQQVKKETSQACFQTDPLPTQDMSSKQMVANYEQALKEVHRLKVLCNTLQSMKSEPGASQVNEADANAQSEVDDMAIQLDGVFRQLDSCCTERDQYKTEIERLKQQKCKLDNANGRLKTKVEQLKKEIQNSALASTSRDESTKLRTLRVNTAQLLTMLMPELNLGEMDYDVDVIDDILQQVLEQAEKQVNGNE